ncbi:MAG: UbiD family decarboxylase [Thermodesulfobacteriota bacterium]
MPSRESYYEDLRDYLQCLEENSMLIRVTREINKDTELMPLIRWQFRGLPEEKRKGFLFENVTDAKGRKYDIPVVAGVYASSTEIYAMAMNCTSEEINQKWTKAMDNPIPPQLVKDGPAQEVVEQGADLEKEGHGLEQFPIPISLPGFDPAPFLTAPCWITRDPETGVPNIGTYRGQVKSRTRTGIQCGVGQHLALHWLKAKEMGKPLEAAIVIGGSPCIGLVSAGKIPLGLDELAVAGGLAGRSLKLVKCKTVDIEVPASAEIVLEGVLPTDSVEPEGPFGEYTGYIGGRTTGPYFDIKCITRRRKPIYNAFVVHYSPSEDSKIRRMAHQAALYRFLKYECNIPGILEVCLHEASGTNAIWFIRLKKLNPGQPWQALHCAAGFSPNLGKIIIAVDEDINPNDPDAILWALAFRMQPHLDLRTIPGKALGLDPSSYPPGPQAAGDFAIIPHRLETSGLLIDATRKWDYPPISLPRKDFMEQARKIWEELNLPELTPKHPWYGYSLGQWSEENEEEAELALKGEHFTVGERQARKRKKL